MRSLASGHAKLLKIANQSCDNAWVLDWDDFRFLLAISREGTLSGAARALKVDQSTVSRRLSAIESAASAKLFDRTPEGYVLTPAGRAVLPSLEQIEGSAISVERKLL